MVCVDECQFSFVLLLFRLLNLLTLISFKKKRMVIWWFGITNLLSSVKLEDKGENGVLFLKRAGTCSFH